LKEAIEGMTHYLGGNKDSNNCILLFRNEGAKMNFSNTERKGY
jgi:hypothetical protein